MEYKLHNGDSAEASHEPIIWAQKNATTLGTPVELMRLTKRIDAYKDNNFQIKAPKTKYTELFE